MPLKNPFDTLALWWQQHPILTSAGAVVAGVVAKKEYDRRYHGKKDAKEEKDE